MEIPKRELMAVSDNKRIAKNTLLLYFRMILLMAVTLYTSRVILAMLGIEDYGIYNLIGGFITVFSFISTSLVSSIQRYLNVALGKGDNRQFSQIYSMSINMFAFFSVFLIIVGETFGYWFVSTQLNIPSGRETAALWVYQVSIITLIVNLFRTPDNAAIIAHERMGFYAYLSIGEALLKLAIVYVLQVIDSDKLIIYVLLYLLTTLIVNIVYKLYCNKNFSSCRYICIWNKKLLKELVSFSGWNLLNSGTHTATNQGVNFFINRYYSVSLNAAQGISAQVYNAVNLFLTNFQTAFKPQLIKTYAAGEMVNHYSLITRTAKFSFYLMLIVVIPTIFNLKPVLSAWLVEVPEYTEYFVIFILMAYLADAIGAPLQTSIYANGNIKGLQIVLSVFYVLQLAVCFFFLRARVLPYISAVVTFVVHVVFVVISLYYAKKLCKVDVCGFLKYVLQPCILVMLLSIIIPTFISRYSTNFVMAVLLCFIDILWIVLIVYLVGLDRTEKQLINGYLQKFLNRK